MAQVQQVYSFLRGITGKANFTLDKKALMALLKRLDIDDDIAKVLSGMNNPSAQVAYKSSKQGFNVAGIRLFNGGKSVGSIAASLSGQGVDDAVVKLRTSVGKNGKYAQGNIWADLGKEVDVSSFSTNMSMKDGVCKLSTQLGDTYGYNIKFNLKDSVDDLVDYAVSHNHEIADDISHFNYRTVVNEVNAEVNNSVKKVKDLINGTADDIDLSKINDEIQSNMNNIKKGGFFRKIFVK